MREIVVIAHDIRSTHNVGSLLRTAEGLGVDHVYFTGYTPYPRQATDERLPHISAKLSQQINKTALGAQESIAWSHEKDILALIASLQNNGFEVVALEQAGSSVPLPSYKPMSKVAIVLGREVDGLDSTIIKKSDKTVEIPMFGKKESFNVIEAATMALYHCRFTRV